MNQNELKKLFLSKLHCDCCSIIIPKDESGQYYIKNAYYKPDPNCSICKGTGKAK